MTKDPRPSKSSVPLVAGNAELPHPEAASINGTSPEALSAGEVAEYVAAMSAELAMIARASGLDVVGYLLEMSAEEANRHSRPAQAPSPRQPLLPT